MARKKVPLVYIQNKYSRRDTFKTRSQGLMKKAGEIATMCGTKACVIIFPEGERVPQVFSSCGDAEALAILNRFMRLKDDDRFMRTMDQESFLKKRICKLRNEALKYDREQEDLEVRLLIHKAILQGSAVLSMEEVAKVNLKVEVLLKSISDRITRITGQPPVYHPSHVQAPTPHFNGGMHTIGSQAPTPHFTGSMDTTGSQASVSHFTGGMHTIGGQAPTPHFTGSMDTAGSQAPTPHFTGGMHTFGAQAPTPHITGSMDTAGTQAPIPHFTGGMHTTGAPASPQQHETWLELMRSGEGDLDALVYSGFNTGASTSASAAAGLNNDGMMQPFDAGFGYPWGGAHPGPSSSSFPPM
uniref:Uncharacterized protein n=1 Tax=Avena sativa TaxID=4498 RepID=A0ACD6AIQ0_AVESA